MEDPTNVISLFGDGQREPQPRIMLRFDDVEAARDTLLKIEAAASLSLAVLAKAGQYGDAAVLDGVREVFAGVSALLAT
jgi:hypothetical protein